MTRCGIQWQKAYIPSSFKTLFKSLILASGGLVQTDGRQKGGREHSLLTGTLPGHANLAWERLFGELAARVTMNYILAVVAVSVSCCFEGCKDNASTSLRVITLYQAVYCQATTSVDAFSQAF